MRRGDEIRCGGARRGKIGDRHNRTALWGSVGVLCARGEKLLLGFGVRKLRGLRDGNVANARCWGINPLSLEQEGRTQCWCARSLSIIGGKGETIFDSLAVGRGERDRRNGGEGETWWTDMRKGLKKIGTGTGERYRYPDARVTASGTRCTRDWRASRCTLPHHGCY